MKNESTYQQALSRLNAYLAEQNLKPTYERAFILQTICQTDHAITPAEITQLVKDHNISRSTVYNTIHLFCLARILCCISGQDGAGGVKYELCSDKPNRFRMICTRCGREAELHDKSLQNLISSKKYTNFNFRHFSLYVYGECKVCRKKSATRKNGYNNVNE